MFGILYFFTYIAFCFIIKTNYSIMSVYCLLTLQKLTCKMVFIYKYFVSTSVGKLPLSPETYESKYKFSRDLRKQIKWSESWVVIIFSAPLQSVSSISFPAMAGGRQRSPGNNQYLKTNTNNPGGVPNTNNPVDTNNPCGVPNTNNAGNVLVTNNPGDASNTNNPGYVPVKNNPDDGAYTNSPDVDSSTNNPDDASNTNNPDGASNTNNPDDVS